MGILSRLFRVGSGAKQATHDREAIAEAILTRYRQRRLRGEFHFDNNLFVELCAELPKNAAQEIVNRFWERRAHSDPRAESKLERKLSLPWPTLTTLRRLGAHNERDPSRNRCRGS